jgi:hypothetical protein
MGFLFHLLISETQLNFPKSHMSFGKGQGWYFNPFQLRKSTLPSTIVTISTFINSAFPLPNSVFPLPLLPSGA